MQGLFDDVVARILANCPAVPQAVTAMDPKEAVEALALSHEVSAIVSPISDVADPVREASLMVSQREVWTFGVTLALVYPGGFAQFEPARDQVKGTLRGWAPAGASQPVQYRGGQLLSYTAGQEGGRWLHLLRFVVPTQATYEHQS
jgi:hypothetical protein